MKTLKAIAASIVIAASSAVQAIPFSMSGGAFQFTGNAYFDNDYNLYSADNRAARGVAEVLEITEGSVTIWSRATASSEYNVIFEGYIVTSTTPFGTQGSRAFESIRGTVTFWDNVLGTFDPLSGDFVTDSSAIRGGDMLIYAEGHGTTTGTITAFNQQDIAIATNGLLDVVGGSQRHIFDTDSGFDSSDLTFNASGDNLDTQGYTFSGSSDVGGHTVPEPRSLILMASGLIGMIGIGKRKKTV